jgi:hypothetical protein
MCDHPITAVQHVSGNLGLDGIDIVHQRRRRDDTAEESGSGQNDQ